MIHHKKTRRWLAEERKCERSTFEKKGADFFAWWTKIEIELKVDLVFFVECKKYSHFSLHITTHVCINLNNKRQNMYLYMKCSTAVPRLTWFSITWFLIIRLIRCYCYVLLDSQNSHVLWDFYLIKPHKTWEFWLSNRT